MAIGGQSNLAIRLATAAVGVPLILVLLYAAPPWAFYLLVLPVALVGVRELFKMTHPGDSASQAVGVGRLGLRVARHLLPRR